MACLKTSLLSHLPCLNKIDWLIELYSLPFRQAVPSMHICTCTIPKVISSSQKILLMSRIDCSSSAIWIPPSKKHHLPVFQVKKLRTEFTSPEWLKQNPLALGPVVRTPVSANLGLNFNLGFFFLLSKAVSRIIFSILFRVSNHQFIGKEN